MKLKDDEMFLVTGGAFKGIGAALFLGIGALITLIVGIVDGYFNPTKCNN